MIVTGLVITFSAAVNLRNSGIEVAPLTGIHPVATQVGDI